MSDGVTDLSFEDALKRLEQIVARLESGETKLDEAIELYSEGDKLRDQCERRLKDAQMRVDKIIVAQSEASASVVPFDKS